MLMRDALRRWSEKRLRKKNRVLPNWKPETRDQKLISAPMSKIRVLPDTLANMIAAGEVVERPASVVKELLENALDAGARVVNIEVESGGKRLIRVVDDGEGMTRDDAIVAFERHATSKLRQASDLEAIATLGFRGEALPSIASVSRLFLRTKTARDLEGTEVEFSGGKLVGVRDIAWPEGTEIEVRDLFFNVPARRKFLKSDATESFHITNLVQHYALANPAVSFLLVNNGRDAVRVETVRTLKERAYQVLGNVLLSKLVEVNRSSGGLSVKGFVSNPQEQRSSRDSQFLFVNGRFVRDQLIGRGLTEAYRSMMPSGTYPAAVLFIETPHSEVDVNVHPAKTEVRFLHGSVVLAFIRDAVAEALTSSRPIAPLPGFKSNRDSERDDFQASGTTPGQLAPADFDSNLAASGTTAGTAATLPPGPRAGSELARLRESLIGPAPDSAGQRGNTVQRAHSIESAADRFESAMPQSKLTEEPASGATQDRSDWQPATDSDGVLPGLGHGIKPLGQIRDSYIVATDDEGLLLVDQHVAHERVLFELFRDRHLATSAGVQPLLIPTTVDLTPAEAEAFHAVRPDLEAMGVEVSELSGRTIAIKALPSSIAPSDAVSLLKEVLTAVEKERRTRTPEHVRDEVAATLACKAAIKINMPLTQEKMQWLIDELMKTRNPMTCPHGRPIIMRVGLRDIERGFKRPV